MKSGRLLSRLRLAISAIVLLLTGITRVPGQVRARADTGKVAKEAGYLIKLPEPTFKPLQPAPLDSTRIADLGFEQVYKNEPVSYKMRDGKKLFARRFSSASKTTLLLLHGVLSSSFTMNSAAGLLRTATNAEVIALDLRGHGKSEGRAGDVAYIGQYTDDLIDVITIIKKTKPGGKIIIAGHSMGGGIALRYAMRLNAPLVDGYLLFAPLLGDNAPTFPKPAAVSDTTADPFLKIHIERITGLNMYNSIGIHQYDSLPVLFFNLPEGMSFNKYTYRSNKSMAPADYRAGIKALKVPFLVLVGSKDEAFVAAEFKPAFQKNSKGEVIVVNGATHNGVLHSSKAMEEVSQWFQKHYQIK